MLRQELNVTAASMHAMCCDTASDPAASCPRLNGITLLYVGGRTHHIAQLRAAAERMGARFVHHAGAASSTT